MQGAEDVYDQCGQRGLAPSNDELHEAALRRKKQALARLGVPQEKFEAPLPPGGLITLAREVLADLEEG